MRILLLVDIQKDFLPGGVQAVPDGDQVVPVANGLMRRFDYVLATQDWHPPDHGSFASAHPDKSVGDVVDLHGLPQILWPDHCIQGTEGACFAPGLNTSPIQKVIQKGTDCTVDSYSGFFDNGRRIDTGLAAHLRSMAVSSVYIVGLATDYCVKYTAVDSAVLGFDTHVILEGIRGIELRPGDCAAALKEMNSAGVKLEDKSQADIP